MFCHEIIFPSASAASKAMIKGNLLDARNRRIVIPIDIPGGGPYQHIDYKPSLLRIRILDIEYLLE